MHLATATVVFTALTLSVSAQGFTAPYHRVSAAREDRTYLSSRNAYPVMRMKSAFAAGNARHKPESSDDESHALLTRALVDAIINDDDFIIHERDIELLDRILSARAAAVATGSGTTGGPGPSPGPGSGGGDGGGGGGGGKKPTSTSPFKMNQSTSTVTQGGKKYQMVCPGAAVKAPCQRRLVKG